MAAIVCTLITANVDLSAHQLQISSYFPFLHSLLSSYVYDPRPHTTGMSSARQQRLISLMVEDEEAEMQMLMGEWGLSSV